MSNDRPARGDQAPHLAPLDSFSEENQVLIAALRSDDPDSRRYALEAIVESIDDEAAHELLQIVESHQDEDFRARAAIVLGPALESCDLELDQDGNLPPASDPLNLADLSQSVFAEVQTRLRHVYEDVKAPLEVRRRALEASARSPRPWHTLAIRNAWMSAEEPWRITALFSMGFNYANDWSSEIEEGLQSDSPDIALEAALAAGRREIDRLRPVVSVIACDRHRDKAVRLAAIEALATLEGSEAALLELSEDRDPDISETANEALLDLESYRRMSEIDDRDLSDVTDLSELLGPDQLD